MSMSNLLAEHGGSIYFAAPHAVVGEAVLAAVNEAYPDAKVGVTDTGSFHFICVDHPNGATSSYMFSEETSGE